MDQGLAEVQLKIALAGPGELLNACRELIRLVPFPCSDLSRYVSILRSKETDTFDESAILTLYELELLLFYGTEKADLQQVEQRLKNLALLASKSQPENVNPIIRLKYHDLLSDFQYFYGPDNELRLMDLVNKKLNSLMMLADFSHPLVEEIQLKVFLFYLMSGADFRKRNVKQYLIDEQVFSKSYGEAIDFYKEAYGSSSLVPPSLFHTFLNAASELDGLFHFVCTNYLNRLLENFIEVNVSKLPQYFASIKLKRINDMLLDGRQDVDTEDIIFQMIVANELPAGTSIDQLQGLVRFGDATAEYDLFNSHIRSICKLVDRMGASPI